MSTSKSVDVLFKSKPLYKLIALFMLHNELAKGFAQLFIKLQFFISLTSDSWSIGLF